MKKFILFSISLLLSIGWAKAQFDKSSDWTWMNGDSTVNNKSYYGIKGVASPLNKPGSRYWCSTWTDTSGNFWLFGGQINYPSPVIGEYNDLWKYDISTNQWTWVNGDSISSFSPYGIYGIKGIAAATNKPGGRISGATWVDSSGNLYLFGGFGWSDTNHGSTGSLNDLWKYNISVNQWTWINGDAAIGKTSVFGQKGISSPINKPGARTNAAFWQDSAKNVWIFGGYSTVYLNELWKYESALNQWVWMTGDTIPYTTKKFGIKGIESPLNDIPGRYRSAFWKDEEGDFWVYGGTGQDTWNGIGFRNDLWRYRPASNMWTWMSGDTVNDSRGIYGTAGIPNSLNKPGGRESPVGWSDSHGNFYLFGGFGLSDASSTTGYLEDIWAFEPLINQWTWIKGQKNLNTTGLYGTKGTPTPVTKPGARFRSASWIDRKGNFWLFGGRKYGAINSYVNDLWKLSISKCETITWTGAQDTSWENPLNWSCSIVPDVYSIVIVNSGTVVINSNVIIKSLSVTTNTNLMVNSGFKLIITH